MTLAAGETSHSLCDVVKVEEKKEETNMPSELIFRKSGKEIKQAIEKKVG